MWRTGSQEEQLVHDKYIFMIQCVVGKKYANLVTTPWQHIIYCSITVAQQKGFAWADSEKVAWLQLQLFFQSVCEPAQACTFTQHLL